MKKSLLYILALFLIIACQKDIEKPINGYLTIFFINDQHGQIDNFSKAKYIIDQARENTDVLVVCAGDMFSGNPVVDNFDEKGYPMIDIMNKVGFDMAVIGNHEFDYGQEMLARRIMQSDFDWVCANVDMGNTGIPQPYEYRTLSIGDIKVTVLGLLETNGKPNATIPSTHPLKLKGINFENPENVVSQYANLKEKENADLYIALTHLGHTDNYKGMGDIQLAQILPCFDLIIGGHSSVLLDTVVNNIPIVQAGKYLEHLGKIELNIKDKRVDGYNCELINLSTYLESDSELKADIDEYNNSMASTLNEVIGFSHIYHERFQVGCFYTDALRGRLEVDLTFQNYGGIRSPLGDGDITVREIYEIDPFHNGAVVFNMTASEIKQFLMGYQSWICYSGIQIKQPAEEIELKHLDGSIIPDSETLTVGVNDYIPAVYDHYFPTNGDIQPFTTAEALIYYLKNINNEVNYPQCDHYFKYQ